MDKVAVKMVYQILQKMGNQVWQERIFKLLLLHPESDNSAQLSQIETEKLLAQLVETEINKRLKEGTYKGKKFNAICHFFGYQARGSLPSKFDCDYAYAMMTVKRWSRGPASTQIGKPAVHPATVDLKGKAYELTKNKLVNCSGTSESSREDVIAMENKIYIEVIRKEYGGRVGGLGLIPSESCVCYNSESTEEVQKLREEVQENKKMVSQLQSQLVAVMEFIRQKMPDCNLGGSRQDPESSGTCYTSTSSNPFTDT